MRGIASCSGLGRYEGHCEQEQFEELGTGVDHTSVKILQSMKRDIFLKAGVKEMYLGTLVEPSRGGGWDREHPITLC